MPRDQNEPRMRTPTLCEPAQSNMHLEISQEPFYAEIDRKNACAQLEHPDQAPAFTPTERTPQCGHTVWGKKLQV